MSKAIPILSFFFLLLIQSVGFAQLEFVQNKGQWDAAVDFRGDMTGGSLFLERNGFTVLLHNPEDLDLLASIEHGPLKNDKREENFIFHSFAYKVKFLNSSPSVISIPEKTLATYNNYFIGNDPSRWASNCQLHQAVVYKNLYPNIDLRYYSDAGKMKYDFIVHPGGDPSKIALLYDGPLSLKLKNEELLIETSAGNVTEMAPYAYQAGASGRQKIEAKYVLKKGILRYDIKSYDPASVLVIDPTVVFVSFTGSRSDNWGYTATPGPDGSFYAAGISFGAGYPTSSGAFQSVFQGGAQEDGWSGYDIAIFKFSPTGSNRLYATYLGGDGNEQPHSMIVDPNGNLVVAGRTFSGNFPRRGLGQVGVGGNYDIVLTKFNSAGTDIIGSVKIGGSSSDGVNIRPKYNVTGPDGLRRNYGDDARSEVILDAAGNIILFSCTQSRDFPVIGTPLNSSGTFGGGRQDGVILKFNSTLTARSISAYFGGNGDDACFVGGISPVNGNIYVGGGTGSTDLPGNTSGVLAGGNAFQGGVADGYITQISANGSSVIKTAYLGTAGIDLVYGLKFDKAGFPYVMGTTTGNWPVVNVNFSNAGSKQFISKLRPDFSAYVYSTVFGTNSPQPNLSPIAFLVDRCENVYVSGWGGGINISQGYSSGTTRDLPRVNPLPSSYAPNDGQDFYFFVLERDGRSQLFGSTFGQNGGLGDHVDGGTSRFDENGVIYQAMCANCGNNVPFPVTPGVWSSRNGSDNCNQAAVKIEMNFTGVRASLQPSINGVKGVTKACVPFTLYLSDTLRLGKKYYWNFGDGRTNVTNVATDSIRFTVPGNYLITLISEDSSTCNIRDTIQIPIRAGNNKAVPDFTYRKLPPCQNLSFEFTNISSASGGTFASNSFEWDFGDGSAPVIASFSTPINHTFPVPGTYIVTLKLTDTSFCNTPDLIRKTLRVNSTVIADFISSPTGCVPYAAVFENTSTAGTDFIWDFGDGTTSNSTAVYVTHTYSQTGVYNVSLIAYDPNTCNLRDTSANFTITVIDGPVAAFTWAPNPPEENTPVRFTNNSTGAVNYIWYFGDGDSSTDVNPEHLYLETGDYTALLIAVNSEGCRDTFTLTVSVIIKPLLDVPNAFTPGQFGINGTIMVRGFGIQRMQWRIYNRWGQLVFESNSSKLGWDGTFKGKLQPMDVYAYTLEAELSDGKKIRKTGDITLLK